MSDGRPTDPADGVADALKLWVVLSRAQAAVAAHAEADVARHGLSITEFGILEALYHKGPMLLGEVQRRMLVSSGGITFLMDRLVRKGLVERRSCPTDRRARYAALTAAGERLIAEIFPAHGDAIARAVSALDPAEQRALTSALKKLGLEARALAAQDRAAESGNAPATAPAAVTPTGRRARRRRDAA